MGHKTVNSLQAARGIAAMLVVAFHLLPIEGKYLNPDVLPWFFCFGQMGVDVFFVISGFVMVMTTENSHGGIRSSLDFFSRRLARIYPIYWFYLLLLLPVFLAAPQLINASQGNQVDLVRSFLLLPDEHLPLLAVAWSLVFEMWFYVVFAGLLLTPRPLLPALLAFWAVVIVAANASFVWSSPTIQVISSPYCLEFIAGALAGIAWKKIGPGTAGIAVATGCALLAVFLATWPTVLDSVSIRRALPIGVAVSLILAGVVSLEMRCMISGAPSFRWAGDISYSVYLSHVLVLSVMGRAWAILTDGFETGTTTVLGFWIACVVAVIGVGMISFRRIERPLVSLARMKRAAGWSKARMERP